LTETPEWVRKLADYAPSAILGALMLCPVRGRWWAGTLVLAALILTPLALGMHWITAYAVRVEALICITAILAVSLNLINGLTGLFSIGHAGFALIGGYTAGILTTFIFRINADTTLFLSVPMFLVALATGGIAAAIFGLVVGLPTLRLRGDYLAIATLGFGEIVCVAARFITFRREGGGEVGGPRGIEGIPSAPFPNLEGWERVTPVLASLVFSLLILALVIWAIRNLTFSSHGRACAAIREDEVAAEILGVDTVFYKVGAFVIGAFFAGIGGGLLAHWNNSLYPDMGSFVRSIEYLIIIYVGGMGSISGALLATVLLTLCGEAMKDLLPGQDAWRMVLYGAILVAIIIWRPQGLYGDREFRWLMPRRRSANGPA
jgi:branched-chain amino acid transport system permease protein